MEGWAPFIDKEGSGIDGMKTDFRTFSSSGMPQSRSIGTILLA
jgi:hypothetical protein